MEEKMQPIRSNSSQLSFRVKMPSSESYSDGYDKITRILSQKKYARSEMGFVFLCAVVAALASVYNFSFGKSYVHDVAVRWGFNDEEAELFSTFCGIMGLVINTAINCRSIEQAVMVVKNEVLKKKKRMPDENIIRTSVGVLALLSVIGATPNLKFVYDATKDGNVIYLAFMEVIQFITMSALNFRGIYNNTVKITTKNKLDVQKFKYEMLVTIKDCLVGFEIEDKDLQDLSRGILNRRSLPLIRKPLKAVTGTYVGLYSFALFRAVKNAMPPVTTNPFGAELFNLGTTTLGLLSSGLRWFLLGNAYAGLVDRIFNLFSKPILTINQNEVRSQYISRNTDRTLAVIGLLVAIFSLGSSSKIVEKYFFEGEDKTSETFWLSLLIGGGAALGINAMDLSTVIERIIDFGGHIFTTKIKGNYGAQNYLGSSHNEMIMRVMLAIASMPEDQFLKTYTTEVNSHEREGAFNETMSDPVNKIRSHVRCIEGHEPNKNYEEFLEGCEELKNNVNELTFQNFLMTRDSNSNDIDSRLEDFVARRPLISPTPSV